MNNDYLSRMRSLLGSEFEDYLLSLRNAPVRGLRINTLKRPNERVEGICAEPSPFAENGWIMDPSCNIGSTPEYLCGHVYPQEPSASFAVTAMDLKPGMRVLDLCAAPGSKSTQIAEALGNSGLLAANEIVSSRASILKENLERSECANAVILNNSPAEIAKVFPEYFDAVLCDAPCSGEGMFRKDPDAEHHWSSEHVASCAIRQSAILDSASECVRPGGMLLYSTCTFSVEENEANILSFLERHPEFVIEPIPAAGGRNGINLGRNTGLSRRIYPMDGGEGHFVARMRKEGNAVPPAFPLLKSDKIPSEALSFLKEHLSNPFPYLYMHKGSVYGGTHPFIACSGLHLIRHQTLLGTVRGNRFEPSHALAISSWTKLNPSAELTADQFAAYRRGETIPAACGKGWMAVRIAGMQAGLVKSDGRILKNHYPKAFRIR
ncbi:MAG: RsmB/NOP family class I SAM-dependent RNA methyltransferase [Solobacterium sp.]|nr:RsmB/NOP family class I SAM-dependent RNA methyltransferase [Solobacterium sp.]